MEIADRYKRAHMVGIGGVGMAALARLLKAQGMCVTGSDLTSWSSLLPSRKATSSVGKLKRAASAARVEVKCSVK